MHILLVFPEPLWAMNVLPGCNRGSGFGVAFVAVAVSVVVFVVLVVPVEGRATMALDEEMDLAVFKVAVEERETARFSGEMKPGFFG